MNLKIGYYDPFNAFPLIQPSLETKLPLTNLHWNLEDSNGFRSIPKLPVQMVEELPKKIDPQVSLRIMFIQSSNLEIYKSQVRPLIKEWLKNLVNPDVEWLIVLYSPIKKEKYTFKTSVYEKLKTDFGINGKEFESLNITNDSMDRCFRLKETNDNELSKPEIYNEFAIKLKEMILSSFSKSFKAVNESIKSSTTKDLIYIELMLKKSRMFSNLLLLKDSLNIITEASKLLSDYNKSNISSYKFELPDIKLDDIDSFINGFHCNILEESNSFNIHTFMFCLKLETLTGIIENENLVSIKSLYISRIFQESILYLSELYPTRPDVLQYSFHFIDWLLKKHKITILEKEDNLDLANYYEFRGDLKLFQRSNLVKMAELKGYKVYDFEDISLDEVEPIKIVWTKELSEMLENETSYYKTFEKITEATIEDFLIADRTKTIDMLSIDLAVLRYKQKDYKESLNILQDSYEFFLNNGWNYMGGKLLEIYIECIENLHLKDTRLLVQSYIKLFANVVSNKVDINQSTKTKKQILKMFNQILVHSAAPIELPISKLFNFEMDPFIYVKDMRYCMSLKLLNTYGIKFVFESITLELSKGIQFKAFNVDIEESLDQIVELFNTKLVMGYYRPIRLTININSFIMLVHEFENPSNIQNSVLNDSLMETYHFSTNSDLDSIFFYPDNGIFNVDSFCNPKLLLGSPSVILKLMNGDSDIESVMIDIIDIINFKYNKKHLINIQKQFKKQENYEFAIPIELTSDTKEISFTLKATFSMNGIEHEFVTTKKVDLSLSISVSVHDIFKSSCLFCNFKIGSAIQSPIKVKSTDLINMHNSNYYKIIIPKIKAFDSILHTGQVYSSFYKIIVNENYKIKNTDEFLLSVKYASVESECKLQIDQIIIKELEKNDLAQYVTFYFEILSNNIKFDYQEFLIDGKLSISNNLEVESLLNQKMKFIEPKNSLKLKDVILNSLNKSYPAETTPNYNTLDIVVPVPNIDILQTIEYEFDRKEKYLVGEPISVNVTIKSSTRWKCKLISEETEMDHTKEELSIIAESSIIEEEHIEVFYLNLVSDENWLVSGFKKKLIKVDFNKDTESTSFELILIPLIIGNLTLPKFLVRFINSEISTDFSIKNGTETLLIVPELEKVTFSF